MKIINMLLEVQKKIQELRKEFRMEIQSLKTHRQVFNGKC